LASVTLISYQHQLNERLAINTDQGTDNLHV